MHIPIETIINLGICIAAFIVWLLAILSSVSMRRLGCLVEKARQLPVKNEELPPITVVVTAHNQENELRRNLPMILEQIYPDFEVIVVDMASKDGTKDLLEKMEEEHHKLHHTFTPTTSRDISMSRLAITLGMKAASHPWVLITQADCKPIFHSWILHMANALCHHRSAQIVLGYTRLTNNGWGQQKMIHFNLWQQMMALPYAMKHGAYRTGGENYIYNRELFMQHQGFASNATLLTGASDIMINHHSTKDNMALGIHTDAVMSKTTPKEKRIWKQERLFFHETRTHFHRRHLYRLQYAYRNIIQWLNHLLLMLSMAVGIIVGTKEDTQWFTATGIALLLGIIHIVVQGRCYNYTSQIIDDRKQNYFLTDWFILLTPMWDISSWLRHKFTNSKQFRKKYI